MKYLVSKLFNCVFGYAFVRVKKFWAWTSAFGLLVSIVASLFVALVGFAIFVVAVGDNQSSMYASLFGLEKFENPKYEILKFLGFIMGGTLLVLQALISYKRVKSMDETARAQADAVSEQAKANKNAETGQRQERLKNAIEHLGHESVSVRLGGAYELFHLAQDTFDLRKTVLEILCAHIRQTTADEEYQKNYKKEPSKEIQSLLTILFVQEYEVFKGFRANLQGSWLNGAYLRKAYLEGAILNEASLRKATINDARLQWASLNSAKMQGVKLRGVHLQYARFDYAKLQNSHIENAQSQWANFTSANLCGAYLQKSHLQGACFLDADIKGAVINNAHLQNANISNARMQGTFLVGTHLQEANINETCLLGATSKKWVDTYNFVSHIRNTVDTESDLSTVIFSGGLSQEDVDACTKGLLEEDALDLRKKLEPHIGKPESHQLPENSGAIIGAYTQADAKKWIAKYEKIKRR